VVALLNSHQFSIGKVYASR